MTKTTEDNTHVLTKMGEGGGRLEERGGRRLGETVRARTTPSLLTLSGKTENIRGRENYQSLTTSFTSVDSIVL